MNFILATIRGTQGAKANCPVNAIGLRLDVLVPVVDGHNHIGRALFLDIELPYTVFDFFDRVIDGLLPPRPVRVYSANVFDSLVRVLPVSLVDALNSYAAGHSGLSHLQE